MTSPLILPEAALAKNETTWATSSTVTKPFGVAAARRANSSAALRPKYFL